MKVQDTNNRTLRQINNEKNIVPPVAQFRAFSVYEDNSKEIEQKKRDACTKREPFGVKDYKKEQKSQILQDNNKIVTVKNESEKVEDAVAPR